MKLLIVEDDKSINTTLAALCGEYWRVQKCDYVFNIKEAIEHIESYRPDVILLDLLLEGELAAPIVDFTRDKYYLDAPRIIAMSALSNGAKLAAIYKIEEFIMKPFDIESLENLIFKK